MANDSRPYLISIRHKGKIIRTSVGSPTYERRFSGLASKHSTPTFPGYIPTGYEHRPDLIADIFNNTPHGWWRICELNNIFDTFEHLKAGDKIYIPGTS